jgi:hypothetical protein
MYVYVSYYCCYNAYTIKKRIRFLTGCAQRARQYVTVRPKPFAVMATQKRAERLLLLSAENVGTGAHDDFSTRCRRRFVCRTSFMLILRVTLSRKRHCRRWNAAKYILHVYNVYDPRREYLRTSVSTRTCVPMMCDEGEKRHPRVPFKVCVRLSLCTTITTYVCT